MTLAAAASGWIAAVLLAGCSAATAPAPGAAGDPETSPSALAGIPAGGAATGAGGLAAPAAADLLPDATVAGAPVRTPWTFAGTAGESIRTPNYALYTTIEYPAIVNRLPLFMEAALDHYRSAIVPLPAPGRPMESFIFGDRDQWERKTVEVIPQQAGQLRNLGRGGFSTRGIAVLYYIDWAGRSRDTLAIAAHEGWHQYTQQTFRNPLPLWLEEGIATYMEGHRWGSPSSPPSFDPKRNYERARALRRLVDRDRLIPLRELVSKSPQEFLSEGKSDLLAYYAQVWALTRFLMEHDDGAYAAGIGEAVKDAAEGRLIRRLARSSRVIALGGRREAIRGRYGPWILHEYITEDIVAFERDYEAFCREITRRRGRRR